MISKSMKRDPFTIHFEYKIFKFISIHINDCWWRMNHWKENGLAFISLKDNFQGNWAANYNFGFGLFSGILMISTTCSPEADVVEKFNAWPHLNILKPDFANENTISIFRTHFFNIWFIEIWNMKSITYYILNT